MKGLKKWASILLALALFVTVVSLQTKGITINVDAAETDVGTGSVRVSDDIKIEGYQISAGLGGNRVVASVEPEIDGMEVKDWGLVYGLATVDNEFTGIEDTDMVVGSTNPYIVSYQSTTGGTASVRLGDSTTATYFVRTMLFGAYTPKAFSAKYKVRAYAILSDGSYVYSKIVSYSVFDVAVDLYSNKKMETKQAHQFLYDRIIKVVDVAYQEVDYDWGNAIIKPGDI